MEIVGRMRGKSSYHTEALSRRDGESGGCFSLVFVVGAEIVARMIGKYELSHRAAEPGRGNAFHLGLRSVFVGIFSGWLTFRSPGHFLGRRWYCGFKQCAS